MSCRWRLAPAPPPAITCATQSKVFKALAGYPGHVTPAPLRSTQQRKHQAGQ